MDASASVKPAPIHFSRVERAIDEVARFHGLPRAAVEATPLPVFAKLYDLIRDANAITAPGEAA